MEALLFVTKKPLSITELSKLTEQPEDIVTSALAQVITDYENRGLKIVPVAEGYIFGTDEFCAPYVDRLVNSKIETTLSPQALETLAIIAYKQPVTKPQIDRIRGVDSDGAIESLVLKRLVEDKGRSKTLGRPILYVTTVEFLRHFGLKNLSELPPLPENFPEQENLFKTVLQ